MEEVEFLAQLVKTLRQARLKLEEAHEEKNLEKFNLAKKLIIHAQRKISEVVG